MSTQKPQKTFENVYKTTYDDLLKYIIFKCNNLEDVNDILQDTYIELYKTMDKVEISDYKLYTYGIAKNKLKKYYRLKDRIKNVFLSGFDKEITETVSDNFNLEEHVLKKITKEKIWDYLETKNNQISKIFYLYYAEDITIKEIAKELNLNESTVKNHLYRTLKELNYLFRKEENDV